MSKKDDGGMAFPVASGVIHNKGMSLRDWMAGMALQGMVANPYYDAHNAAEYSEYAYKVADAMIAERAK
jgi:hypothetical protein